jgi:hypothetical protein
MLKLSGAALPLALIALVSVMVMSPDRLIGQTRADSLAIASLIAPRALQDARRQAREIRNLVVLRASRLLGPEGPERTQLLRLVTDSLLILEDEAPICPWFGGRPEAGLELAMGVPTFSGTSATVVVLLGCAAGSQGRGSFGWAFTYRFRLVGTKWMIASVTEDWIT